MCFCTHSEGVFLLLGFGLVKGGFIRKSKGKLAWSSVRGAEREGSSCTIERF